MASNARIGLGTVLYVGNTTLATDVASNFTGSSAGTYFTAIAEMQTINTDWSVGEAEITSLDSTGAREFLPTLVGATISGSMNWIATNHSTQVHSVMAARTILPWKIRFPSRYVATNTTAAYDMYYFKGFVTALGQSVAKEEGISGTISIRISDSTMATNTSTSTNA